VEAATDWLAFDCTLDNTTTARFRFGKRRKFARPRQIGLHVARLCNRSDRLRLHNREGRCIHELAVIIGRKPRLVGVHRLGHSHSTALQESDTGRSRREFC